ncbi:MAG: hypothetical protein ACE37H_14270 [Phycisphaeraceae bacterium]
MLGGLIELVLEWWFDDDTIQMDDDRCKRCTADLARDLAMNRKHCSACGKRISRAQRHKWQRFNRDA